MPAPPTTRVRTRQGRRSGPTAPDVSPDLTLRCRDNGLIVVQLAGILPSKAPARLLQKAIEKFALVELALLQRKKPLAQTRALDLIQFLIDNRPNLINASSNATAVKLGNVIDALLCLVGLPPTGVSFDANTGVGIVPANNTQPVIIRTPQGNAGIKVPIGGAPGQGRDRRPGRGGGRHGEEPGHRQPVEYAARQVGVTIDLNDSQDVQWQQGGVTVAICITEDCLRTVRPAADRSRD